MPLLMLDERGRGAPRRTAIELVSRGEELSEEDPRDVGCAGTIGELGWRAAQREEDLALRSHRSD
jgi:hypothetical protein